MTATDMDAMSLPFHDLSPLESFPGVKRMKENRSGENRICLIKRIVFQRKQSPLIRFDFDITVKEGDQEGALILIVRMEREEIHSVVYLPGSLNVSFIAHAIWDYRKAGVEVQLPSGDIEVLFPPCMIEFLLERISLEEGGIAMAVPIDVAEGVSLPIEPLEPQPSPANSPIAFDAVADKHKEPAMHGTSDVPQKKADATVDYPTTAYDRVVQIIQRLQGPEVRHISEVIQQIISLSREDGGWDLTPACWQSARNDLITNGHIRVVRTERRSLEVEIPPQGERFDFARECRLEDFPNVQDLLLCFGKERNDSGLVRDAYAVASRAVGVRRLRATQLCKILERGRFIDRDPREMRPIGFRLTPKGEEWVKAQSPDSSSSPGSQGDQEGGAGNDPPTPRTDSGQDTSPDGDDTELVVPPSTSTEPQAEGESPTTPESDGLFKAESTAVSASISVFVGKMIELIRGARIGREHFRNAMESLLVSGSNGPISDQEAGAVLDLIAEAMVETESVIEMLTASLNAIGDSFKDTVRQVLLSDKGQPLSRYSLNAGLRDNKQILRFLQEAESAVLLAESGDWRELFAWYRADKEG